MDKQYWMAKAILSETELNAFREEYNIACGKIIEHITNNFIPIPRGLSRDDLMSRYNKNVIMLRNDCSPYINGVLSGENEILKLILNINDEEVETENELPSK